MPEIAGVALQDSGVIDAMKASDKWRFVRKTSYLKSSMQLLVESWKYNLNSSWGQNLWCTTFCWVITRRKLLVQLLAGHSKYNHAYIYIYIWEPAGQNHKPFELYVLLMVLGFRVLKSTTRFISLFSKFRGLSPSHVYIYIYTVYIYLFKFI